MKITADQKKLRILHHIVNLDRLFPNAKKHGLALYKALRRYECKLGRLAERQCCDSNWGEKEDVQVEKVETAVKELLNDLTDIPIYFNMDPRGYALKIEDSYVREESIQISRDWGGYGILAPDPNEG